ncbi:tetratricopeptide repeat protein [Aquimarina aquimarini]|uniref:tetratricopeptide repeat protein n=1 Tax=Aquimarina aquimarini TaxID=1191734 RepID=UPI000D556F79|nr:tetratricopeptide repeat protein [Aquimarina aquimarini]
MNKIFLFFLLQFLVISSFAQSDSEIALTKAKEAIKLMDEGKIDKSIELLEESQKLDSKNYIYPYEIAYAYVLKKEYKKAIKILKKVKKYETLNSQVYQMSGNCYSYLEEPDKAIKEYEEGMNRFPNSGNLHLEKGNIFLGQEKYDEAIKNYENGIDVDPTYTSNYYRLAKLFLNSTDKLSGLIYGEIFMNLERTTERTQEISELLYDTYQSSITLSDKESKIDFCEVIIDASEMKPNEEIKLPLCAIFGKNFILAIINEKTIDLNSLSLIRQKFIENYFKEDFEKYPNVLFNYQKELLDENLFDAYNHYLFQIGAQDEFNEWIETHNKEYDEFVEWYTKNENIIDVNTKNKFIR